MTIGKDSPLVLFNDGEQCVADDYNAQQNVLTQRAWEVPGYSDLLSFARFGVGGGYDANLSGGPWHIKQGVFVKGGGLLPLKSGLTSSLGGGFLGTWSGFDTGLGYPLDVSVAPSRLQWVYLPPGAWSHNHNPAPSGQFRYDLVTCAITTVEGGETIRSFADDVTGALTSTVDNKLSSLTLDLDPTTAVVQGAAGATPSLPVVPGGRRVLYCVRVSDSAITDIFDCTVPAGPLITSETLPAKDALLPASSSWTNTVSGGGISTGGIVTTSAGQSMTIPAPSAMRGDPNLRMVGVAIRANLNAGDSLALYRLDSSVDGGALNLIADLTGSITTGGALGTILVDLRGLPALGGLGRG